MTTPTRPAVIVIGVGNPWRRDDGAGPAVATALRRLTPTSPAATHPPSADDHTTNHPVDRSGSADGRLGHGERPGGADQGGEVPDRPEACAPPGRDGDDDRRVEVVELDGEAARLVDAWDGADLAIVVDTVRTGATPGTVHHFDIAGGPGPDHPVVSDRNGHLPPGSGATVDTGRGRRGRGSDGSGTSSHGLGVAQAAELGGVLGRLPQRLVLVGIEGADFGPGDKLTDAVAAAVEPAAKLIAELIDGHATEPVEAQADVTGARI